MAPRKPWSHLRRQAATTIVIAVGIIAAGATVAPPAGADDATTQIARTRAGGDGQTLTDGGATHVQPAWSPDGSTIAYDANPDGSYHLFVMDTDGGNQTQLTSGSWNDVQPAWSPDGSRIAFSSDRDGSYHIYTMASDGSDVRRVTSGPWNDIQPTWSPDGGRIGFASNRGRDWDIFTVATDGHALAELTLNAAADVQPAWSPDGGTMAFASNRERQLGHLHHPRAGRPSHATPHVVARRRHRARMVAGRRDARLLQQPERVPEGVLDLGDRRHACSRRRTAPPWTAQPSWKPTGDALAFAQLQAPAPADIFWGIYSAPRDGMSSDQVIEQLESEVGRQFTGERIYQNLTTAQVPTPDMERLASIGGYIYLNINSFSVVNGRSVCARWADVAAGRYDARWTEIAQEIKDFGYTIHLGYHHEMTNDTGHHPVCGTAADYRRAYNHLHDLFTRLGVTNVQWVWAPTASAFITGVAWRYEPANYDVLGVDGYSRTYKWRTPAQIFVAAHRFAVAHGKAIADRRGRLRRVPPHAVAQGPLDPVGGRHVPGLGRPAGRPVDEHRRQELPVLAGLVAAEPHLVHDGGRPVQVERSAPLRGPRAYATPRMSGEAKDPGTRPLPGIEKPKRFRPTFHYELIACGFSGHELVGMDAAHVRPQDEALVREAEGIRWYRCLRCDSWLPLPPPTDPAKDHIPDRDHIELPLRGRALRDKFVLRLIADRPRHPLPGPGDPGRGGVPVRGEPGRPPRTLPPAAAGLPGNAQRDHALAPAAASSASCRRSSRTRIRS